MIGVGLNVAIAPEELPRGAARDGDLAVARGRRRSSPAADALAALNRGARRWVDAPSRRGARASSAAATRSPGGGSPGTAARGSPTGIDDAGHLLVETGDDEQVALGAGEVHLSVEL